MSLILPEIYNVENINENWIVQFTEDNSNAFDFDGVDDYISFGDIMGTYTSFTLEAWIYLDSTASKPLFSLGQYDGTSGESATTNTVFALSIQNVGDLKVNWEYGDGVSDININDLIRTHKENKLISTITAVQPPGRFGSLQIENSKVSKFIEKPDGDYGWINGGFFVFEPDVFDYIEMFYNCKRKHGSNNLLSPVEYENRYQERLGSV